LLSVGAFAVALGAAGQGEPPARFEMQGGGAWVASSRVGLVTLIDGASAQVSARVKVANGPSDLGVAQREATGYAVDRRLGTVSRIDPTTFAIGPRVEVIDGASGRVAAYPTDDGVYVIDEIRGRIAVTAPDSVDTVAAPPSSLAGSITSTAVDGDGRLWALMADGDLTWFDGPERHDRHGAERSPATSELVLVDGRTALVERAERRVTALTDRGTSGDRACIEMDTADETVRFAGSVHRPWVYVVSGDDGLLRVSDLGGGNCTEVAIPIADPGDDLGSPREVAGRVFVPDFTAGSVAVVDVGAASARHTDELVPAGTTFELFGKDGIAFYNDPNSERAGVVHLDGTFTAVSKYNPANPGAGVEPPDGRDPPATGDGEVADKPDDKPDDPSSPDDPDRPDDPPPPDPDRPAPEPPRPGDTRPPRPDERRPPPDPGDPTIPSDPTVPPPTDPPPTDPPPTDPPPTDPPPTDPPPTDPPPSDPPPPVDTPPVVPAPTTNFRSLPGGGPCGFRQLLCQLEVSASASDPEDGIVDLRTFVAATWSCRNASSTTTLEEGTPQSPFLLGATSQATDFNLRQYGCDGQHPPGAGDPPPGSLLLSGTFEIWVVATNGIGLQTESQHVFEGVGGL